MMVFHVSEEGGIARFDPRPHERLDRPAVWAVDAGHLCNYLVPRDCPRVCFRAPDGAAPDQGAAALLAGAHMVVAIEAGWLERARATPLHLYRFEPEGFAMVDPVAGYLLSHRPVVPTGSERLAAPLEHMARLGADLLVVPSLWPLHDRVLASGLDFSMIRMRNARPRIEP